MSYLVKAIRALKPESEFAFQNDDYSTIEWHVLEGNAPTRNEIDAQIEKIKTEEATTLEAKITSKAALLEKLGITADEAKLLLA
jgi:hypothetical protein